MDRGITNPTVVCKTDGKESIFACFDTAVAFRDNPGWNDGARRTISRRNRHSRTTRKIKRQRDSYNWHNVNARDYAEWLLAPMYAEPRMRCGYVLCCQPSNVRTSYI